MKDKCTTINGISVPTFLYGTAWKEDRTADLTRQAIAAGFRGIDTANQRRHYHEVGVGEALSESDIPREKIFLQTKFTYLAGQDHRLPYNPDASPTDQVRQSFQSSLEHLKTDYIDSYVLHGPSTQGALTDVDWEVWGAMEEIHTSGKTKFLGVSNVNLPQLEVLVEKATVQPTFVQNRCYARNRWDGAVREFCQAHDILYQGFSLLTANVHELSVPPMAQLVQKLGRSIPEIVFRFAQQVGMIPLTGTTNAAHMAQDLTCYEFELSSEEIGHIENIAVK